MANFYVSTTGNDNNSGLDQSSAFATLERAQEAMRQSGGADTTYLAGGTYHLDSPIHLTSADSGSSFVASPGQNAIVSGGTPITGWTQGANGVWSAHVDDAQVLQLTVNGVQQVESRFPNVDPSDPIRGGWLWGQDLPGGADPSKSLAFNPSDFPSGHAPQVGQTVTVFSENGYANDHLTIASVSGNVMTFTPKPTTISALRAASSSRSRCRMAWASGRSTARPVPSCSRRPPVSRATARSHHPITACSSSMARRMSASRA